MSIFACRWRRQCEECAEESADDQMRNAAYEGHLQVSARKFKRLRTSEHQKRQWVVRFNIPHRVQQRFQKLSCREWNDLVAFLFSTCK